jgi:toxin CcdB|tara:strand:- start:1091 stop:1249 length:159 start_codon:yes stop_codon:yes gene_type:complete
MERYKVYKNMAGTGYLLDVQADILIGLSTRVVVPLMPLAPARYLNPIFIVDE